MNPTNHSRTSSDHELESLFPGNSELAARMRAFDWSKTDLGPPQQWPDNLRISVSLCLTSRIPIVMYWGPNFTVLYNDAYISFLGESKHPRYLGQPGRECWREIWDTIGPMLESVYATGSATLSEDVRMFFARRLPLEEVYVRFTFGPILARDGKTVQGIFCPCTETTEQVVSARRLETHRKLGLRVAERQTAEEACQEAATVLAENPNDIPFAAIYLVDETGTRATNSASVGFADGDGLLPSSVVWLKDAPLPLPLASVLQTQQSIECYDLSALVDPHSDKSCHTLTSQVLVLPIAAATNESLAGLLLVGISPHCVLDAAYRTFFDLVSGFIGTAIANARAYEAERKRTEALVELDRAKTAFFSNISHEFRTPLTLMLGPLEDTLSQPTGLNPGDREQLETVHRNALRLLKLVNTLLDFSRIEAGRVQAVYEPTDLAMLTADLAGVFRSAIERAGVRLVVDCAPIAHPVYVDREMWEKIVLNLLSNAFKFTFEGEIRVSLRLGVAGDGGDSSLPSSPSPSSPTDPVILLEVQDTGTGIPTDELPQIFERFHRVQGAKGRTYEGSGIGLSLVQELVHLHGGTIRVSSVVDQGTTFTIAIPAGSAHLPSDRIRANRTLISTATGATPYVEEALRWLPEENGRARAWQGEGDQLYTPSAAHLLAHDTTTLSSASSARILLADDNTDMRDYVKRLLSQRYEVDAVVNGRAALTAIRQRLPDLVLADVMMPELDGFELVRSLRSDPHTSGLPIILLSARAGEEARAQGLESGADDYLTKPFAARELLTRVEATLRLAQLRQETTQREQMLRLEAEAAKVRLESVLAGINDQFIVLDREWRYTFVNDQVLTVVGKPREELLGKSIWEIFPEAVGTIVDVEARRAVAEQTVARVELFYPPLQRWFENRIYPFANGVTIFVTDISDRKRIEESLHESLAILNTINEATPILIFMKDRQGRLKMANPATLQILGKPADEVIDKTDVDFYINADAAVPILENDRQVMETGHVQLFEEAVELPEGTRTFLSVKAPYRDMQGTIIGLIGVSTEITERKRSELEREQLLTREQAARTEAERANRVKDEFLAIVSHELRSPLNPILGWSTLLQTQTLDPAKTAHALSTIRRNAKLQAELIEDLLDISRILRGKLSLDVGPTDVASTIQSAMETVRLAAIAKSIHIDTRLEPNVGLVSGDSSRLQQVVWNLLSNAIKFTPNEGRVEVRLERIEGEQTHPPIPSYAQITVKDTGKGIHPDFLPYVFDYFRQEDGATTRKFGGLGLGLAIVHHLVELHGGTVRAESLGEGQGATFTVRLPLMSIPTPIYQDSQPSDPGLNLTGIEVLVVDDDADTREFVAFLMEHYGANVTAVASAREALAALARSQPHVLLSDIGMPEMDGYMLMRQVRTLPPEQGGQIPAIALTAYAGEIDYQQAMSAGFQQHIPKPIDPTRLVEAIASLVEQKP